MDSAVVEAILKEKFVCAHIHFERICDNNTMDGYLEELFNPKYFHYVDVIERPSKYIGSSKYADWLSKVSVFI